HDQVVVQLYEDIKNACLPHFDAKLPTKVFTDGSLEGIAGECWQKDAKGVWRPYAFFSRRLTQAEKKWPAIYIEILACTATLLHFRSELLGTPITIYTDCTGLASILKMKSGLSYLVKAQQDDPLCQEIFHKLNQEKQTPEHMKYTLIQGAIFTRHMPHKPYIPQALRPLLLNQGLNHFLIIVEAFTKFSWTKALRSTGAEELISAFKEYILTFGAFHTLIADQGSAFKSQIFRELLTSLGCKIHYAPVYWHNPSGLAEANLKTIGHLIATFCEEALHNWPTVLQAATFCLNTSVRSTLSASPFSLLFGYEAFTPARLLLCLPQEITPPQKLAAHIQLRTVAQETLNNSQAYQKHRFDAKRRNTQYRVNDKVLVFRPQKKIGAKFLYSWTGPETITRRCGQSSYMVSIRRNRKLRLCKYHVQHIKKYVTRPERLTIAPAQAQRAGLIVQ
ncbi:Transposon Ty3-G Gag-Pol polyprotein, partial [Frankliniella fusca]